jgi:hypothetical protein
VAVEGGQDKHPDQQRRQPPDVGCETPLGVGDLGSGEWCLRCRAWLEVGKESLGLVRRPRLEGGRQPLVELLVGEAAEHVGVLQGLDHAVAVGIGGKHLGSASMLRLRPPAGTCQSWTSVRYENLLMRSFQIVRRKPWLLLLALLAQETSSGSGGGGGSGLGGSFQVRSTPPPTLDFGWVPLWLADRVALFIEIGAVVLVLSLAWFLVSCIASGALISAVARVDAGEPITFGGAWRIGVGLFRRVLAFKLLIVVALLLPALVLAVPPLLGNLAGTRGLLVGLVLDAPLLFAYFYWVAFLRWFAELGLRACVLDGHRAGRSFGAAWALLKRRFHRVAMTTLVFIGVGFGIGILTSVLFSLLEAPLVASGFAAAIEGRWSDLAGALLLWLPILVLVTLAVSSAVGAYFATAWTVAYRRFDVEGEVPAPLPLAA